MIYLVVAITEKGYFINYVENFPPTLLFGTLLLLGTQKYVCIIFLTGFAKDSSTKTYGIIQQMAKKHRTK